jgi:hypothetical protein
MRIKLLPLMICLAIAFFAFSPPAIADQVSVVKTFYNCTTGTTPNNVVPKAWRDSFPFNVFRYESPKDIINATEAGGGSCTYMFNSTDYPDLYAASPCIPIVMYFFEFMNVGAFTFMFVKAFLKV